MEETGNSGGGGGSGSTSTSNSATMRPIASKTLYFSTFPVTSQIFHLTPLSMALVNLKPLLPGHVLVCPRRVVPRLRDLTQPEVTDLFLTVQKLTSALERIYGAQACNIGIQDGEAAGQSVKHLHAHIIPRRSHDLKEDEIYKMIDSEEGDVGAAFEERETGGGGAEGVREGGKRPRPKFPTVKADGERVPRSDKEMVEEAEWLAGKIKELENSPPP